ncbi:hypothetical protein CUN61_06575 [Pseudomonas arsenicoxydans]|uniref:Uncharacterized protein n=1 Tax=Pseudomonas arsenicoxydans TaxID=702115 RepID=A0A4P6GE12_9PSED|nr:hypothetical protein CUN61_06575 [Pseudomonas arsenicoxydans]
MKKALPTPGNNRTYVAPRRRKRHEPYLIVPTLCVGMPLWTLRVHCDAERHGLRSHADGSTPRRGNDQSVRKPRGICG